MQAQQARQAVAPAAAVAAVPGEVRVPYIPQVVRDQIRDEVKAEVMTQAKAENWAQPNAFPDWASRISFDGDVRLRYESRSFGNGSSNQITDFAELSDDGPYDVSPNTSSGLPPLLNTREDRDSLLRLRALRPQGGAVGKLERRHPHRHRFGQQPGVDHPDPRRRLRQEGPLARPGLPDLEAQRAPEPDRRADRQSVPVHRPAVFQRPQLRRRGGDLQPAAEPRCRAVRHGRRVPRGIQLGHRLVERLRQGRQRQQVALRRATGRHLEDQPAAQPYRRAGLLPLRRYRRAAFQPLPALGRRSGV